MIPQLTYHSHSRAQKRGIPPLIIQWLMAYGEEEHDHRGGRIFYFSKKSRHQLAKDAGEAILRRLAEFMDAYAVLSGEGLILTCGHRYKRVNRD